MALESEIRFNYKIKKTIFDERESKKRNIYI